MQPLRTFTLALLLCRAATAQTPYPTTSAPPPVWGGYTLPAQVPYQPTLSSGPAVANGQVVYGLPLGGNPAPIVGQPHAAGQAYTLAAPVPLPPQPGVPNVGQTWQPYPDGTVPPG